MKERERKRLLPASERERGDEVRPVFVGPGALIGDRRDRKLQRPCSTDCRRSSVTLYGLSSRESAQANSAGWFRWLDAKSDTESSKEPGDRRHRRCRQLHRQSASSARRAPLVLTRSPRDAPDVSAIRGDLREPDSLKFPAFATLYCTADATLLANALPRIFNPSLQAIGRISSTSVADEDQSTRKSWPNEIG